jgi:hypothetical protein
MTVTIELPPGIEATFSAQAAAQGMSLQEYLRHVLLQTQVAVDRKPITPRERAELWRRGAANLPRTSPLPDEAISREAIYETRG